MPDDDDDDDFIPKSDADFDAFSKKLLAAISPDPAKYGLTPEDVEAYRASHAAWTESYGAHLAAQEALRASTESLNALATQGGKDGILGMPETWSPPRLMRRSGPSARPVAWIEPDGTQRLLLRFPDMPDDAHLCEIREHLGERAPTSPASYAFLAELTRSPYVSQYEPEDAGKRVFYILRWQSAERGPGPWSAVLTATIPE